MPSEHRELTTGDPAAAALLNRINCAAFFSLPVAAPGPITVPCEALDADFHAGVLIEPSG